MAADDSILCTLSWACGRGRLHGDNARGGICICMYIYIYIYIYTCIQICISLSLSLSIYIYIYISMYFLQDLGGQRARALRNRNNAMRWVGDGEARQQSSDESEDDAEPSDY